LVTFFYAELPPGAGLVRYVNAGHNAPFVLRSSGEPARLPANGMALGVVADTRFQTGQLTLEPGERLFLFTDGATEAFNARDQEYGEERLAALLLRSRELDAPSLIEAVKADVL